MNNKINLFKLVPLLLGATLCTTSAQDKTKSLAPTTASADPATTNAPPKRFDEIVREDFFNGTLNGDRAAFDRVMKVCTEHLAKNSNDAPALVWHGNCLMFIGVWAFQTNDIGKGLDFWGRGMQEMNTAVKLAPLDVQVRIPRGAAYISSSKYVPDPAQAKELLAKGLEDYEQVLQLQQKFFHKISNHARGELLFGLADGYYRMGNEEKSRAYLTRITKDCAGSKYSELATEWLGIKDDKLLREKSKSLNCIGCHGD